MTTFKEDLEYGLGKELELAKLLMESYPGKIVIRLTDRTLGLLPYEIISQVPPIPNMKVFLVKAKREFQAFITSRRYESIPTYDNFLKFSRGFYLKPRTFEAMGPNDWLVIALNDENDKIRDVIFNGRTDLVKKEEFTFFKDVQGVKSPFKRISVELKNPQPVIRNYKSFRDIEKILLQRQTLLNSWSKDAGSRVLENP